MSTELAPTGLTEEQVESLLEMDVNNLLLPQRNQYLWWFAKRQGLDPLLKPFDLLTGQDGKLKIYANRSASDQLRKIYNINIEIVERGFLQIGNDFTEVFTVRSRATMPDGRTDESLGAIPLRKSADPDTMANAVMKCETKAKRRVTLSICGLGLPDETEVESFGGRKGEPLQEPRRIFPQNVASYPAASVAQPIVDSVTEHVNMKTGEIVDVPVLDPEASKAWPGTGPEPVKSKYPPAVPPVNIKK